MKIVGHTDEITVCDCCGKKNLKATVALERADGEVVFYGSDCAGAAVSGRKTRNNGELALIKARRMQHLAPIFEAINSALKAGATLIEARDAGRAAADKVSPIFRNVHEGAAAVNGFDSWGCINVHWTGVNEKIEVAA